MRIIAHRGASGYARENTLASCEKAIELRSDYIEIDVRRTGDNELIVYHDAVLDDGRRISEMSYGKICSWADMQGWHIPVLNDVLTCVVPRVGINIEIKDPDPLCIDLLIDACEKIPLDAMIFSSFDHACLKPLQAAFPSVSRGVLVAELPEKPLSLLAAYDTDLLITRFETITREYVAHLHAHSKRVFTWTVDETDDIERNIACGVDGIMSNYPDRVRNLLA